MTTTTEVNEPKPEAKTEKKMWKIEGEAFEKVKAASSSYDAAKEAAVAAVKEAHENLWDAVKEALPEDARDENLQLDSETEALGFYIVKEHIRKPDGLLGALIAAARKA